MSFLKKLFGSRSSGTTGAWEDEAEPAEQFDGYMIAAAPIKDGGQYRLAGTISKEIGGEVKTHNLIRADTFANRDEAVSFTIRKAKQVIGEQGDRMFG